VEPTLSEIEALERKAKAATTPSAEWERAPIESLPDAVFIAAAKPATVKALCKMARTLVTLRTNFIQFCERGRHRDGDGPWRPICDTLPKEDKCFPCRSLAALTEKPESEAGE